MDPGRPPGRILCGQAADEHPNFSRSFRSASACSRLPLPEEPKSRRCQLGFTLLPGPRPIGTRCSPLSPHLLSSLFVIEHVVAPRHDSICSIKLVPVSQQAVLQIVLLMRCSAKSSERSGVDPADSRRGCGFSLFYWLMPRDNIDERRSECRNNFKTLLLGIAQTRTFCHYTQQSLSPLGSPA
jgi:hypothetical protein